MKLPSLDTIQIETSSAKLLRYKDIFGDNSYNEGNTFIDDGFIGNFHLDMILTDAIETGASDIHITADQPVSFTNLGDIEKRLEYPIPDNTTMFELITGILKHQDLGIYVKDLDYDFAYKIKFGPYKGSRFRGNVGKSFGSDFLVFRVISNVIPSMDKLAIESEIIEWAKLPNGLWLICGPTGTGKSTTLASVIRHIQLSYPKKIITIEKPVEYVYPVDGKALIVQRTVGEDCIGFYEGLTAAMRQNPDIILIGEVRNTEEVTELLRAAETGHLAISTMHTNSCATTLNRIQSLFTGNEQRRVMSTLADSLRGLANQVLLKKIDGGRFACREILTINEAIKKLINSGDIAGVRKYQMDNKITMEHSLARAVKDKKCTIEEAIAHTSFPEDFKIAMENV